MVGIKGNRRTLYSKKVIIDAFLLLLQENNLNKITVTEICKEADINRGTFYSYYNDPFDLMRSIEEEMIEKMMSTINNSGDKSLYGILNSTYESTIAEKKLLPNANETLLEYYFTYSAGGTIEAIRKWINDDMEIPPEKFVQMIESMYVI